MSHQVLKFDQVVTSLRRAQAAVEAGVIEQIAGSYFAYRPGSKLQMCAVGAVMIDQLGLSVVPVRSHMFPTGDYGYVFPTGDYGYVDMDTAGDGDPASLVPGASFLVESNDIAGLTFGEIADNFERNFFHVEDKS